jgi:MFS family permease
VHTLILGLGAVVAVAAAVRSTWSPCGLSMLSTITPFGERSRGHRYAVTASWFVAGAVLGGLTLGGLAAGLAAAGAAIGVSADSAWLVGTLALAAAVTAAIDADVFGPVIPIWRRQVNDQWLARYRSWVYGVGFGWQIGVGVVTYIMTAAVFLVVLTAALSLNPVESVGLCAWFGLARGLAVLLTARADSPARLRALHQRFDALGPAVRVAVIAVQAGVALVALAVASARALPSPVASVAVGVAAAGALVAAGVAVHRKSRRAWAS